MLTIIDPVQGYHRRQSHGKRLVEYNRHVEKRILPPLLPLLPAIEQGKRREEIRLLRHRGTALFE